MKHGLDDDGPGVSSDFGTGLTTRDSVFNYIAARTTTYFVAILTNKVDDLGLSRFVDCENKRIKCDTTNASTCGSGYDEETAGCD